MLFDHQMPPRLIQGLVALAFVVVLAWAGAHFLPIYVLEGKVSNLDLLGQQLWQSALLELLIFLMAFGGVYWLSAQQSIGSYGNAREASHVPQGQGIMLETDRAVSGDPESSYSFLNHIEGGAIVLDGAMNVLFANPYFYQWLCPSQWKSIQPLDHVSQIFDSKSIQILQTAMRPFQEPYEPSKMGATISRNDGPETSPVILQPLILQFESGSEVSSPEEPDFETPKQVVLSVCNPLSDHRFVLFLYPCLPTSGALDFTSPERQASSDEQGQNLLGNTDTIAHVSHEFRTPLNGIVGMSELLLGTSMTMEQRELAEVIHESSIHLMNLINDLLDLTKIQAGRLALEEAPCDIRRLFQELVDRNRSQCQGKNIQMTSYVHPDVPVRMMTDPLRFRQILDNLVSNAVKYTEKGFVNIAAFLDVDESHVPMVHFQVSDTGIGIPSMYFPSVFNEFSQFHSNTYPQLKGTGLGLSISKRLVEMMGGQIGFTSAQGKGSTFWFSLPLLSMVQPEGSRQGGGEIHKGRMPSQGDVGEKDLQPLSSGSQVALRTAFPYTLVVTDHNHEVSAIESRWALEPGQLESRLEWLYIISPDQLMAESRSDFQNRGPFLCFILEVLEEALLDRYIDVTREVQWNSQYRNTPWIIIFSNESLKSQWIQRVGQIPQHALVEQPLNPQSILQLIEQVVQVQGGKATIHPRDLTNTFQTAEYVYSSDSADLSEFEGLKVLVVEDNAVNQKVALMMFNKLGMNVDIAQNGLEALKMVEWFEYDIIFMDCQMPCMNGYEATRMIRSREEEHFQKKRIRMYTPIVAMTAHAMKGDKEKCLASGMDAYLTKPLVQKDVISAIQAIKVFIIKPSGDENELNLPQGLSGEEGPPVHSDEHLDKSQSLEVTEQEMDTKSVVDLEAFMERIDFDQDFFKEVTQLFLSECPLLLEQLDGAIRSKDYSNIKLHAHSIKGMCANLSAETMQNIAFEVEMMGKDEQLSNAQGLSIEDRFEALQLEFRKVQVVLTSYQVHSP